MKGNRIEALLEAMKRGREQFEKLMEEGLGADYSGWSGPAFAVNEVYDLRREESLPVGSDGEQMNFFTMAGSGLAPQEAPG